MHQIQTNQLNALKSTGPKNTTKTRFNALRHGLLAKNLLIDKEEGEEDARSFYATLAALREDLQPEGAIQEILVERIAQCYWRLKRATMVEKGLLRQELDDHGREAYDYYEDITFGLSAEKHKIDPDNLGRLIVTAPPSDEEISEKIYLIEDELGALKNGNADFNLLKEKYGDKPENQLIEEHTKKLQERIQGLEFLESERNRKFKSILEYRYLTRQIPFAENMDHVLRYETTIERQLYRALNQLMQLKQSQRIGFVSQKIIAVKEEHMFQTPTTL